MELMCVLCSRPSPIPGKHETIGSYLFPLFLSENIPGGCWGLMVLVSLLRGSLTHWVELLGIQRTRLPLKCRAQNSAEGLLLSSMPESKLAAIFDMCSVGLLSCSGKQGDCYESLQWRMELWECVGTPDILLIHPAQETPSYMSLISPSRRKVKMPDIHFPSFPCSYEAASKHPPAGLWFRSQDL